MINNLTKEQQEELDEILVALCESLDITQTQFDNLSRSYNAVGDYLKNDPQFERFNPIVTPQGSLRLGTIIQPINVDDDLDVDLVFRLSEKNPTWTQKDLKDKVGTRLKDSNRYSPMVKEEEGRRCWTLLYRDNSDNPKEKYHMDILPSVADKDYANKLTKLYAESFSEKSIDQISIRITDNKSEDYNTSKDIKDWLKSNPDGYALWFANRCKSDESIKMRAEDVVPIGKYNKEKTTLQRIVQILKRHRDIMFSEDTDNKPISIIITTLAAKAYHGEKDLLVGLTNVVTNLGKGITKDQYGIYWVANPVNPEENFADKWETHPKRKANFFKWLDAVKQDLINISDGSVKQIILKRLQRSFGKDTITHVATILAERRQAKIAVGAALLTNTGTVAAGPIGKTINTSNTFYGD